MKKRLRVNIHSSRRKLSLGKYILILLVLVVLAIPSASIYYSAAGGKFCARCHEIQPAYRSWHTSTHRDIACKECHGGLLTMSWQFHKNNLSQLMTHLSGNIPERIKLEHTSIDRIMQNCKRCHEQAYAQWQAGPHSATYENIFLDEEHNSKRMLTANCLRCHGMHFAGSINDLVTPIDTQGPWLIKYPHKKELPSIPCLACHQIHKEGTPLQEVEETTEAERERTRPSLAFYDRRARMHWDVDLLPLPAMMDEQRPVRVNPDSRQALCYQCHAPFSSSQVRSGDDRTCIGVHEGISCLACHQGHTMNTKASCQTCHPQLSNCGIDVETMDTTFKNPESSHNIHFVKCRDCHRDGVPKKTPSAMGTLPR